MGKKKLNPTVGTIDNGNQSGEFYIPPTRTAPPPAMQGHWVEPRSGRQLHIAADGKITFDNGSTKCNGEFFSPRTFIEIDNGFLKVDYIGVGETFWFGPFGRLLYARTGVDELRLLRWLKERGRSEQR